MTTNNADNIMKAKQMKFQANMKIELYELMIKHSDHMKEEEVNGLKPQLESTKDHLRMAELIETLANENQKV